MNSRQPTTTKQSVSDSFKWWQKILNLFRKKPKAQQPIRRKVDIGTIRSRLSHLGWYIKEIPIRRASLDPEQRTVANWRIIAIKNDRSFEVTGKTLDEAIKKIGISLGVVSEGNL